MTSETTPLAASDDAEPQAAASRTAAIPSALRVALLVGLSVFVSRLMGAFYGEKLSYLYKEQLGLTATAVGTLGIITGIPGYLRPFMGAGSDIFPLFGFHRKTYYALSWLIAALGFGALALLTQYHVATVTALIIVAGLGANLLFVVMDAVMVEIGNQTGTVGRLQSIQQGVQLAVGALFAGQISGYVSQYWTYPACFTAAALCALIGTPLSLLIEERRVTGTEAAQASTAERERQRAERRESLAALKQAAASPGLWAIVGYVFYLIITPGTGTAQFYYMVDVLHLSKLTIGRLGSVGSAGAVVGILLFGAGAKRLPVRAMVWGAYLMDCILYLLTFIMVDERTAYLMTFITGVIGIVYTLCLLTLAARACPPHVEGTVYGLVIAAQTLAGTLGEKIGATIYERFGAPEGYTGLDKAALITHGWHSLLWVGFAFTLVACVFIPFLPAWTKSSEPLRPTAAPEGAAEQETVADR